jgi:hypothetical protein
MQHSERILSRRILESALSGAALLALLGGSLGLKPATRPAAPGGPTVTGQFNSVACYGVNACVAVGSYRPNERAADRQLVASWNGHAWTVVPAPSTHSSYLQAASCVDAQCLLVGETANSSGIFVPFAEVWDKAQTITDTMAPATPAAEYARLSSASCLSKTYCFVVGQTLTRQGARVPLAMRFDGSSWTTTPIPYTGTYGVLAGVSCVPKRFMPAAWCQAVGQYRTPSGRSAPLALGWNGIVWTREDAQNPKASVAGTRLLSVSCRHTLCLAVGASKQGTGKGMDSTTGKFHQTTLSEQLVSSGNLASPTSYSWRAQPNVPKPGVGSAILSSVSCRFSNICKGAGTYYDVKRQTWRTLIEVWQNHWSLNGPALCNHTCTASVPNTGWHKNFLSAVSCISANACMAVGDTIGGVVTRITKPLGLCLQHASGYDWTLTPNPKLP